MLSVVFPILNEIENPYFWTSLQTFFEFKETQVIVVDGGSDDGTLEKLVDLNVRVVHSANDRASRINDGVKQCSGETILLHHPRSVISIGGVWRLLKNPPTTWGGFKHGFDDQHPLLNFTSWYSNYGRRVLWGILYLDHCIFFPREIISKVFPLPPVEIFEDTYLSYNLKEKLGKPLLLSNPVKTSAIRFKERGVLKHGLNNQLLKAKFLLGEDCRRLNHNYEKQLRLNSKR